MAARPAASNRLDEVAIAYAFALWAVGLANKGEA